MNNVAMNICIRVFVWTYVFISLGYVYLGEELLGHMVTLCLTFWELLIGFPMWLYHFTILPAVCKGSSFPHPGQHLLLFACLTVAILLSLKW